MIKIIRGLDNFYSIDNKLLYVSNEFIGYEPVISQRLTWVISEIEGVRTISYNFVMDDTSFHAILTTSRFSGPLRGYRRVEIFKDEKPLIKYEWGGMGHGSNYSNGIKYHIENNEAFLLKINYITKCYLFWFKDIVIMTKGKS